MSRPTPCSVRSPGRRGAIAIGRACRFAMSRKRAGSWSDFTNAARATSPICASAMCCTRGWLNCCCPCANWCLSSACVTGCPRSRWQSVTPQDRGHALRSCSGCCRRSPKMIECGYGSLRRLKRLSCGCNPPDPIPSNCFAMIGVAMAVHRSPIRSPNSTLSCRTGPPTSPRSITRSTKCWCGVRWRCLHRRQATMLPIFSVAWAISAFRLRGGRRRYWGWKEAQRWWPVLPTMLR